MKTIYSFMNMKSIITSWRYWALVAITTLSAWAMIAEPSNACAHYWATFVAVKVAGIALAAIAFAFGVKWYDGGKLEALRRLIEED